MALNARIHTWAGVGLIRLGGGEAIPSPGLVYLGTVPERLSLEQRAACSFPMTADARHAVMLDCDAH